MAVWRQAAEMAEPIRGKALSRLTTGLKEDKFA
jgi:hypothetical protein